LFSSNYRVNDIHDYKKYTREHTMAMIMPSDDEGSKILGDRFEGIKKD
jgi:hypothetical protein